MNKFNETKEEMNYKFNNIEIYGEDLETVDIIKCFENYDEKPVCVFGVLLTEEGKLIKEEMLQWLNKYYNVYIVEQLAPGVLFEFPAIRFLQYICQKDNLPYALYVHTKGAANPNDSQVLVRKLWALEFTEFQKEYLNIINSDKPKVAVPFTGKEKNTWFNGFFINKPALDFLNLVNDDHRYHFEAMFRFIPDVEVVGRIYNDIHIDSRVKMWLYIKGLF